MNHTPATAIQLESMEMTAQWMLEMRRKRLGPHRDGWWSGRPNPYSVVEPEDDRQKWQESVSGYGLKIRDSHAKA